MTTRWVRLATRPLGLAAILMSLAGTARADDIYTDERGLSRVKKGVWELDLGSLFAFANDQEGDSSVFKLTTDMNGSVSYFLRDNLSVGATGILTYDRAGDSSSATTYGVTADAAAHLRLGHGAFLRPGLSIGGLFGTRTIDLGNGMAMTASQVGFTARVKLPLAYFISRNLHFEGGPQFNFTTGSFSPEGMDSVSFTTLDGGFSVGAGYSF